MINTGESQEERRLADERCVDALLAEVGVPIDPGLRDLLLDMRKLRVTDVPEPSAELAALLGQPGPAEVTRLEDWPRKHRGKKRVVFTALAVAASLGIAGGAAAGVDGVRSQAEGTIRNIISSFTNQAPATPVSPPTTPAPALPDGSPEPAPAVEPTPAAATLGATTPAGTAPAGIAPDQVPGSEPSAHEVPENPVVPGRPAEMPQQAPAPFAFPPAGGRSGTSGPSHPVAAPARGGEPSPGRADISNNGKAKGQADSEGPTDQDAATGQDAGTGQEDNQPKTRPTQGNRP